MTTTELLLRIDGVQAAFGFQFGHRVRCHCGVEIEYPGMDQRGGHVLVPGEATA